MRLTQVCAWTDCDSTDVIARGLCQRDYRRAKRQGILQSFVAPPRKCVGCGVEFRTKKNGRHGYCSDPCRAGYYRDQRIQRRMESRKPCAECGELLDHTQRSDAIYCSVACQQSVWYRQNEEMLKSRAAKWKLNNRDKAKDSHHRRRALMRGSSVGPIDYQAIWDRDGGKCWICEQPVDPTLEYPDPGYRSWDHIIPIIAGGAHDMSNVALSHLRCNTSKKSKILDRRPAWASEEVSDAAHSSGVATQSA